MKKNENLKTYSLKETAYYKIHGRTNEEQFPLPLFFNGSAVEVNVTGTELWIDIETDYDCHEPWAIIEINGALIARQMLPPGSSSVCLFRNMDGNAIKNVRFIRELQSMCADGFCHILVKGFQSDGTFLPVSDPKYKLEFIGDSITSGEGTYGANEEVDWISMFMSFSHNYARIISKALDADCRLISQGGWGVLCGWDNHPDHNIPSRYEKVCGLADGALSEKLGAGKPYDFQSWKPDAIIVNLGTNDASAFNQPMWSDPASGRTFQQRRNPDGTYNQEDLLRFKQAVIDFLHMLRRNNPDSHIIWCYGMLGYDLTFAITDAMNQYTSQTGDHNLAFLQLPNTTAETVGSHAHPGYQSHKRAAKVLIEYLEPYLASR